VYNVPGLDAYQVLAQRTALYSNKMHLVDEAGNKIAIYPFLGLGEAGEAQGKIKKAIRDDDTVLTNGRKIEIMYELGDLLWYVSECARQLGYELSYVAKMNINKLHDRAQRNALRGDGDTR
jgi:NTP pyrophosphatase (non-canonical NTP hydrolase)